MAGTTYKRNEALDAVNHHRHSQVTLHGSHTSHIRNNEKMEEESWHCLKSNWNVSSAIALQQCSIINVYFHPSAYTKVHLVMLNMRP